MNKYFKALIFLGVLWLVSFLVATFVFDVDTQVSVSDKIAVIPVNGMITLDGSASLFTSAVSAEAIVDKLQTAEEDNHVKAVMLEVNSPGGTVLGSKRVADELKDFSKPVLITEQGTSGAYWIASQGDVIVADELSMIGSIGVIGSYLEFSGLLDDYNVTYQRLVAGDYKDVSSPYKEMTDEEEEMVQERLDAIHDYFINEVADGRGMSVEDVEAFSEGMFYLGYEAKEMRMVDYLGDKEFALNLTETIAGINNGHVDEYVDEEGWFDSLVGEYLAYSSYFIGQGIGSVLVSSESSWSMQV